MSLSRVPHRSLSPLIRVDGSRGDLTQDSDHGMLGLYLHIPFCEAICSYCNFNRGLLDADLKRRYLDALNLEIASCRDAGRVDSVFFGGGTPSVLEPSEVSG